MALLLASAAVVLVLAMARGDQRRRAVALGCFFGGAVVLELLVGYGRAGLVRTEGLPDRYALLAAPALFAAWFAWQLFGPSRWATAVHLTLLLTVLLLLPGNVGKGHEWRDWYTSGMRGVERDIDAGATPNEIAARHGDFLMHWNHEYLARSIELLRKERIGPFAEAAPNRKAR